MHARRALLAVLLAVAGALATAVPALAGTPALGTHAQDANLRDVPGTIAHGEGYAVPLKARRPAWYTADLHRRVVAADGAPVAAPNDAPLPGEVGIRPGSWILFPKGCTTNFVFSQGSNFAIGTAGHCAKAGQTVTLLTLAPGGANPVLVAIGKVSVSVDRGVGNDFALIPIDPKLNAWVSPTNAVIGGPCGAFTGSGIRSVLHYGHGLAIGTGGTPRAGVAATWKQHGYGFSGAAIFGDSGSSVRLGTFPAAGNLTHLVVDSRYLPSNVAGTRISRIQQLAGGWKLANSPLCA